MPLGKRPLAENNDHRLMDALRDLQVRLSHTSDKEDSLNVIELYDSLVRGIDKGRRCHEAAKCMFIIKRDDLEDIKRYITNVVECIRKEDSNFLK